MVRFLAASKKKSVWSCPPTHNMLVAIPCKHRLWTICWTLGIWTRHHNCRKKLVKIAQKECRKATDTPKSCVIIDNVSQGKAESLQPNPESRVSGHGCFLIFKQFWNRKEIHISWHPAAKQLNWILVHKALLVYAHKSLADKSLVRMHSCLQSNLARQMKVPSPVTIRTPLCSE